MAKEYKFYGWETADVAPINKEYAAIKNPREFYDLMTEIWSMESCAPRYRSKWTKENKTLGQCSITSFLAQDIFGGEVYGIPLEEGGFHCYNVVGECVFDTTSEQFGDKKLLFEKKNQQFREAHFADADKKARYELIKKELKKKLEKVYYIEMRPQEFIDRINECPIAYLPLGTLEWHGLHMPLGADGIQSSGVFARLAREVGGVVLPMLFLGPDLKIEKDGKMFTGMEYYGFEEGQSQRLFGSSYYVEKDLFKQILDTVARNLARTGFKILVAHGHGPSIYVVREMAKEFKEKYDLTTYTLWDLGLDGDETNEAIQCDHAAGNETSICLAVRPDLVDITKLDPDTVPTAIWGEDPRIVASEKYGNKMIADNFEMIVPKLKDEVSKLKFERQEIKFHDTKNLLDAPRNDPDSYI